MCACHLKLSHHVISLTVGMRVWLVKVNRADPCRRDRKGLDLSQSRRARVILRRQRIYREKYELTLWNNKVLTQICYK